MIIMWWYWPVELNMSGIYVMNLFDVSLSPVLQGEGLLLIEAQVTFVKVDGMRIHTLLNLESGMWHASWRLIFYAVVAKEGLNR